MTGILAIAALLAAAGPADPPPVPDRELATMRGGVMLPNGLNVAIGIDIQTRIDGVLALHTIFSSETPNRLRVFTDGTTSPVGVPGSTAVTGGDQDWPGIAVSRSPTGTTVVAPGTGLATGIKVVAGPATGWIDATGQTPVPVVANGPAIIAETGTIRLTTDDRGAQVALMTPAVEVRHLIGQATGAVIANTANDISIDTVSTINVELIGLPAGLMNGVLMVNRIAAEAAGRR